MYLLGLINSSFKLFKLARAYIYGPKFCIVVFGELMAGLELLEFHVFLMNAQSQTVYGLGFTFVSPWSLCRNRNKNV